MNYYHNDVSYVLFYSDLEINTLWCQLVSAACRVTGKLRLKITQLLLRILGRQTK